MTPQRPALAEVLAALDAPTADGLTVGDGPAMSPVEAVEALATARLWPWEPGDEAEPRWWCRRCGDPVVKTSDIPREASAAIQRAILGEFDAVTDRALRLSSSEVFFRVMDIAERATCVDCGGTPHGGSQGLKTPAFLGDVVTVASLGAPQLARYVHLAGEIARAAGCAGTVVVWRVMPREAITEHHRARHTSTAWLTSAPSLTEVFTTEEMLHLEGGSSWRRACDWGDSTARAAWPALRSLAIGDEATPQPTGVHLLALDASRIILAVEAL